METKTIKIFDTTLRDGEQTPGVSLNIKEKLEIARELVKMRVDVIEAGFPIASPGDFAAVKAIAEEIQGATIAALARANTKDIDRAYEALKGAEQPRIHTFLATSNIHMTHKLKMSREQVLETAVASVKYAKNLIDNVEFSAEDASRSDLEFLYQILTAVIDAGASVINVPDTVGYTTPDEYGFIIRSIKENVPNIDKATISVHCHNDLGMAVANSLAAVANGATQVECTINGLGERAGNAALEELIMAINTRKDFYNIQTSINQKNIYRTSRLVSYLTGINVQPNKAIVGANAFAHESGIHQHGVLNESSTYEIITPESIGLTKNKLVLGKHSGRHAFEDRLKDMGYNLPAEELNATFEKFKVLADKKKEIFDKDIEALLDEKAAISQEVYELDYMHVLSGTQMLATAAVRLKHGNELFEQASTGDGPVDAVFKAIQKSLGLELKLTEYFIKAVTSGEDALGEVTVRVASAEETVVGRGLSTDVVEASAKAFINAVNKLVTDKGH